MAVRQRVRRRVRQARPRVRRTSTPSAAGARRDAKQSMSGEGGLTIGGVQDPAEKAADRMADRVMRLPAAPPVMRRKCAQCEGEDGKVRREGEEPEAEEKVQTKPAPKSAPVAPGAGAATASAGATRAIRSMGTGKPLARSERAFFEPRFGADLSAVRVHDGPAAERANRAVGARAFALGTDIAFARGERQSGSDTGRRLMAHELAHVVAEDGTARRTVRRAFGNCTSKSDENTIVTSHTVANGTIAGPGDKADITLQFGCKPRSFDSQIIDSAGNALSSKQKTIWNKQFKPNATGRWSTSWDGKRSFSKVGTFLAIDGTYRHRIKNVAYAAGAAGDKVATDGKALWTSPNIQVTARDQVSTGEKHLKDAEGVLLQSNIDDLATAIRSEAEGYDPSEQKAIAWAIRNEMVRVNSHSVADAKAAFNFADNKTGTDADKAVAKAVLSEVMSNDTTGGAVKWYSPRSMPPHNGACKTDGGIYDCTGGTVTLGDGSKKSSKAPGFHNNMTFVNVAGVNQWNFRFYKL